MGKACSRRDFLKAVGATAATAALGGFARLAMGEAKRPPNVILVLIDDMGWTDLGCYGSEYYETPNIDRLCREGMKFTDGYAACAVCSPTRAAVMTGRYPARLGITDWIRSRFQGGRIPEDHKNPTAYEGSPTRKVLCPENALWMELEEVTIPEAIKPAGYTSCHIGKWHLGADDWYPDRQGFDYNIGGCDYGQPPTYFDPYFRKGQGDIPTLKPRKEGEYLTDREADEAVQFIRQHADGPFFLYFANYAVHTPIEGRKDLVEKYKAKEPPGQQKNPVYAAMVESVDQAVGRILETLDELKLTDDTLIIFTSDNGGLMGPTHNAPLRSGKGYPYEGGIREPFIVRWPGVVKPGSQCSQPVCSIDLLPTVCEAAGIKPPADRAIDGVSIMPLLKEAGSLKRDALFWHFPHYRYSQEKPYSIIRQGDWKLIKRYDGKPYELFNLREDLSETIDLSEKMPGKVRQLDARLQVWLRHVNAKMPVPNPDYRPES